MPVPGRLDAVGRPGVYHHNRSRVTDQHVDDHIHDHNDHNDHNDDDNNNNNNDHAGNDHHVRRWQLRHRTGEYTA